MTETARERILGRLRAAVAPGDGDFPTPDFSVMEAKAWPPAERLPRLRRAMEAVKAEFLVPTAGGWPAAVRELLRGAGARHLMYGPESPLAPALAAGWEGGGPPRLVPYDRPVEEIKPALFSAIDAGITTCLGGIAETGGLILRPSPAEPRLLSLVPPIHLVLLDPARIWDSLWHALRELGWERGMPANALVISGPSKTADIEQTLAYGVHGPKRLVVVLASETGGGAGLRGEGDAGSESAAPGASRAWARAAPEL
jgi:L-lactate dehydrogenase complex protein LldG